MTHAAVDRAVARPPHEVLLPHAAARLRRQRVDAKRRVLNADAVAAAAQPQRVAAEDAVQAEESDLHPQAAAPVPIIGAADAMETAVVRRAVDSVTNVAPAADHAVRRFTKSLAKSPIRLHCPKPCRKAKNRCGRSVI